MLTLPNALFLPGHELVDRASDGVDDLIASLRELAPVTVAVEQELNQAELLNETLHELIDAAN